LQHVRAAAAVERVVPGLAPERVRERITDDRVVEALPVPDLAGPISTRISTPAPSV
jgi:hypothetical protein